MTKHRRAEPTSCAAGSPAFGSDAWLRESLLALLVEVRAKIDALHEMASKNPPASVDFDAYHYAYVPRRQRRVWRHLVALACEHDWVLASGDSDVVWLKLQRGDGTVAKSIEHEAALAIVAALTAAGIDCHVRSSYR